MNYSNTRLHREKIPNKSFQRSLTAYQAKRVKQTPGLSFIFLLHAASTSSSVTIRSRLPRVIMWIFSLLNNTSEIVVNTITTHHTLQFQGSDRKCISCFAMPFLLPGPSFATNRLIFTSPGGIHPSKLSESHFPLRMLPRHDNLQW